MAMNNYLNPARRVRPTVLKLTHPQSEMLNALNNSFIVESRAYVASGEFYWPDDRKVDRRTLRALAEKGFVKRVGVGWHTWHWLITDLGRAALAPQVKS